MQFANWPKITDPQLWEPIPRLAFLIAGDAGGKKFHMMDCKWAGWITHPLYFLETDQAAAKGFSSCWTCRPRARHPVVLRSIPWEVFEDALQSWKDREARMILTHSLALLTHLIKVQFSDGSIESFRIIPDGERPSVDQISITSPLGASIIHAREGQKVRYRTPNGEETVTILQVRTEPRLDS